MWWTTYKKSSTKAKIAKKDLTVYKIVLLNESANYSDYDDDFELPVNQEFKIDSDFKPVKDGTDGLYDIHDAIFSFSPKCILRLETSLHDDGLDIVVFADYIGNNGSERYHPLKSGGTRAIAKCIIPKGSTYYENEDGKIASDRIIATGNVIGLTTFYSLTSDETGGFIDFDSLFKKHKKSL